VQCYRQHHRAIWTEPEGIVCCLDGFFCHCGRGSGSHQQPDENRYAGGINKRTIFIYVPGALAKDIVATWLWANAMVLVRQAKAPSKVTFSSVNAIWSLHYNVLFTCCYAFLMKSPVMTAAAKSKPSKLYSCLGVLFVVGGCWQFHSTATGRVSNFGGKPGFTLFLNEGSRCHDRACHLVKVHHHDARVGWRGLSLWGPAWILNQSCFPVLILFK